MVAAVVVKRSAKRRAIEKKDACGEDTLERGTINPQNPYHHHQQTHPPHPLILKIRSHTIIMA